MFVVQWTDWPQDNTKWAVPGDDTTSCPGCCEGMGNEAHEGTGAVKEWAMRRMRARVL